MRNWVRAVTHAEMARGFARSWVYDYVESWDCLWIVGAYFDRYTPYGVAENLHI